MEVTPGVETTAKSGEAVEEVRRDEDPNAQGEGAHAEAGARREDDRQEQPVDDQAVEDNRHLGILPHQQAAIS